MEFSGVKPDNEEYGEVGDVVAYPLSERKLSERDDDITHGMLDFGHSRSSDLQLPCLIPELLVGIGFLVSRNLDRGDAKTLPKDRLLLCELEPLFLVRL